VVLGGLDVLALECNHDAGLLADGDYPPFLKQRIAGDRGHLSNRQAADLLGMIPGALPPRLIAAHLSRSNNRPDLARDALADAAGRAPGEIAVADQDEGLDWIDAGRG
jgi:phosphoribosyl 1,2-cyclic phosphodiesterase